jgi:hypothetical protein
VGDGAAVESPITGMEIAENVDTSLGAVGAASSEIVWQPTRTTTATAATVDRALVQRIFTPTTLN